jgi:hypothetical protein
MVWIISRQCDEFVAKASTRCGISVGENDENAGTSRIFLCALDERNDARERACQQPEGVARPVSAQSRHLLLWMPYPERHRPMIRTRAAPERPGAFLRGI